MTRVAVHYGGPKDSPGPILKSDIDNTQHVVHGAYGLVPLLSPGGTLTVIDYAHITLTWVEATPFEMAMAFTHLNGLSGPGWRVARHLLASGGGDGDIHVEQGEDQILLRLSSPTGAIVLSLAAAWIDTFIDLTEDVAPSDHEFERLVWKQ
jgi:hypothetical protein